MNKSVLLILTLFSLFVVGLGVGLPLIRNQQQAAATEIVLVAASPTSTATETATTTPTVQNDPVTTTPTPEPPPSETPTPPPTASATPTTAATEILLVETETPTPTATIVSVSPTPTAVPPTPTPTGTPTPDWPVVAAVSPDEGSGAFAEFPPLHWAWPGDLAEDEYFEVRIWHETISDYRPALGLVKGMDFAYNLKGERIGIYYWSIAVVRVDKVKLKDWYQSSSGLPPVWEPAVNEQAQLTYIGYESEARSFKYSKPASDGGDNPSGCPPFCN
jgi:hypothetical protein